MMYKIDWRDILGRAAAVFFPERCVLCQRVVAYDDLWCQKCGYEPLGEIIPDYKHNFTGAVACAVYEGGAKDAVLRIKRSKDKRTLLFFAGLMKKEIESSWNDVGIDVLVPVPMSASKLLSRGFNQAQCLAEALGALLEAPVAPNALLQHDDAVAQHELRESDRFINAEASFEVSDAKSIEGKTVLLCDDVYTTGATSNACAGKLIAAGAARVYVAAATSTRKNPSPE